MRASMMALAAALMFPGMMAFGQASPSEGPYKLLKSEKVGGDGGFDYVFADSVGRRLYIPRSGPTARVAVYDLDSLKSVGVIADTRGVHGATVSPKSGHGFSSSNPVVMWDTKTLATIKTIPVQGSPDGILYEPLTERIYVLSHRAPNVTVINAADGEIVGTIDLGGAPEQGASDGMGHVYIDLEDKDNVAVVDAKAMKVTGHYDLASKGGGPAGLSMDVKNHILFVGCHNPATCVVMNAEDGKILATLPIGNGIDAAEFNPDTMESFTSQRDGTLTVIKEKSPTEFVVEQNVKTKTGAKTSTLDSKTGQIFLITAEQAPPPAAAPGQDQPQGGRRGGRGATVPGSFQILVVGK